jgi:hypothetical protein
MLAKMRDIHRFLLFFAFPDPDIRYWVVIVQRQKFYVKLSFHLARSRFQNLSNGGLIHYGGLPMEMLTRWKKTRYITEMDTGF